MPIYGNGSNKIGKVYYGGNKIGKVYYGSDLVYQSISINLQQIPGTIYWDARGSLGVSATYRFYDKNKKLILESETPMTSTEIQFIKDSSATYYENVSGNTIDCFASADNYKDECVTYNKMFGASGWILSASDQSGFQASLNNTTKVMNAIRNFESSSAMARLYELRTSIKPYGFSNWLWASFDDVTYMIDNLKIGDPSPREYCVSEYDAERVILRYYESSKWKTRNRDKADTTYPLFIWTAHWC